MKYSLIIVAYKAETYLRKCLKSIKESKIEDAEVILVDNSPEPIFGDKKEPANCRLPFKAIWDGQNLGFAGGCNLGVKFAKGEILVFVNPDTEVYEDWADRLAARLNAETVAVGPMASGYVSGYQKAQMYGVQSLGLKAWKECRKKFKGQTMVGVKVLIGFFLMMTRKVFDDVGGMDEACFLGSDDLDLSLRLRDMYGDKALAVAKDVCIMHDGNKSFQSRPSKEVEALVKQSEDHVREKLYIKYKGKPPSATELWGAPFWNTERERPMTVSVSMITSNESQNLRELLPQLGFADEIIICENGSKASKRWFKDFRRFCPAKFRDKVKVFDYKWISRFGDARTFSLSKCTSDWILWLDADDRVPEHSGKLIRALLDKPGWKTWNKRCCFEFIVTNTGMVEAEDNTFHQMRLFPNLPGIKWTGRVHENVGNSLFDLGTEFIPTDIGILHTGYSNPELLKQKHARNKALLDLDDDTPAKRFNLGNSWGTIGEWGKAEAEYRSILTMEWSQKLNASFLDHVRYMVGISMQHQGKLKEAAPMLDGNKKPDCVHLLGEFHMANEDFDAAFIAYREYLNLTAKPVYDPWMSWRPKLRKHAYSQIIRLLLKFEEQAVNGANAEYPTLLVPRA